MKVAFFDRDGTIIRDYPDEVWRNVQEPEFINGSFETLSALRERGYEIIIITNQYLINEGYISIAQFEKINNEMLHVLKVNGIEIVDVLFCPHRRDEGCDCSKPQRGMIDQAIQRFPEIDLQQSFVVGDAKSDMEVAIRCGMKGYWISSNQEFSHPLVRKISHLNDLLSIVDEN